MRMTRKTFFLHLFFYVLVANSANAAINNNADIVHLRTDCSGKDDCFTTMSDVTNWLWNTRKPTPSSRVKVSIGPGNFGRFVCPSAAPRNGYVSLIGSGRTVTRLVPISGEGVAVLATNCEELGFQDLAVITSNLYALRWDGDGSSVWINIDVTESAGNGWYENCGPENKPLHYWYNVRFSTRVTAFPASCSENWFFGSELVLDPRGGDDPVIIRAAGTSKIHLFGSVLRARIIAGTESASFRPDSGTLLGVVVAAMGIFHMHGGIVSLLAGASTQSYDVIGIKSRGGHAHTPGTAFNISAAGSGTAKRLEGSGIHSPFQWPSTNTPPAIVSNDGSDQFIETDCDATGNCNTAPVADQRPHMMVYAVNCAGPGGPWFDMATNKCRGQ